MMVSSILSGLIDPAGAGYALTRAAARFEPIQPAQRIRGSQGQEWVSATAESGEVASASRFDTQDVVELSPAARQVLASSAVSGGGCGGGLDGLSQGTASLVDTYA